MLTEQYYSIEQACNWRRVRKTSVNQSMLAARAYGSLPGGDGLTYVLAILLVVVTKYPT